MRLDYDKAILFGISDRLLHPLEMAQRSAARIVMQIQIGDHDDNTAAITHAACKKSDQIQATGSRSQGFFVRWHARVSRGTALQRTHPHSLRTAGRLLLEVATLS